MEGKERKVGFEIEFASVSTRKTAELIQRIFGGDLEKSSDAKYVIKGTDIGDFTVELDAIPLQKIAKKNHNIKKDINSPDENDWWDELSYELGRSIGKMGEKIVPVEVVAPPVALSKLDILERLCEELEKIGAEGTKESFYFAFGLHINPEVISLKADYLLGVLQSFLLLYPWLKEQHDVDMTRQLSGYVHAFPASYLEVVLAEDYSPDLTQLIKDYHEHNPSRNRALDMLPVFAYIDEKRVRELYGQKEKINNRPTFHYRLPNCALKSKHWSLNREWKLWLYVEALAEDKELRTTLIKKWQQHQDKWFSMDFQWKEQIEEHMPQVGSE